MKKLPIVVLLLGLAAFVATKCKRKKSVEAPSEIAAVPDDTEQV